MGGLAQALSSQLEKRGAKSIGEAALKFIQSGEYSLNKQGPASGLLAKLLRTHEQTSATEASKVLSQLMGEAEYVMQDPLRHAEYYQQRATGKLASDARTARYASVVSDIVDGIYNKHARAGFKVAPRVKGPYFPDKYPREVFEPGTAEHEQAVNLLRQKRGYTEDKARRVLDSFNPNQFKNPLNAPFHHIESNRTLHLPEIARKDAAVDLEYIAGGIRRFHEKQIFGENASKARVLLDQIRKESGNAGYEFASGIYSTFMGYNSDAYLGRAERAVQSLEIASHLGLAVFSHPGKTLESAIVGGLRPFAQAVNELATDKEAFYEFGMRSGASMLDTLHEARRLAQVENETLGSKVLRASQFQKVINFQEMLHANVGKHAALGAFADLMENPKNQNALMMLKTLGIDVASAMEKGGLGDDDLLRAGYKMSKIVLGGRSVLDLPPQWRNHWSGRLLTMFKPFFFNQSKFIKDQILKPAFLQGNIKPLLYAGIIYPALGEVVTDLKYFMRGKGQDERPDIHKFPTDRVVENLSQVGAFGVASDVLNAITTATPSTTWQFLGGPVMGDMVDAIGLVHDSWEQRERFFLRRIPTIGPAVSRHLAPPKHRKKGFFEKGGVTKELKKIKHFIE